MFDLDVLEDFDARLERLERPAPAAAPPPRPRVAPAAPAARECPHLKALRDG